MNKLIAILFVTLSLSCTKTMADSQVVYSCINPSSIVEDSQVVYSLGDYGATPELYCKIRDLIIETLENQCGDVLKIGKEIILKNFKVSKNVEKKGFGISEVQMDIEVKIESRFNDSLNSMMRKSVSLEKIKIRFESEDSIKPTLDNLKVVDISSSGVCK